MKVLAFSSYEHAWRFVSSGQGREIKCGVILSKVGIEYTQKLFKADGIVFKSYPSGREDYTSYIAQKLLQHHVIPHTGE